MAKFQFEFQSAGIKGNKQVDEPIVIEMQWHCTMRIRVTRHNFRQSETNVNRPVTLHPFRVAWLRDVAFIMDKFYHAAHLLTRQ